MREIEQKMRIPNLESNIIHSFGSVISLIRNIELIEQTVNQAWKQSVSPISFAWDAADRLPFSDRTLSISICHVSR